MKEFIYGTIFGILISILLLASFTLIENDKFEKSVGLDNYNAFKESTNQTINGIWFPKSSFCVSMDRKNIKAIEKTFSHEYAHELINKDHKCGNQTCYKHFCKVDKN